jgi:hypothetical protein
VRTKEQKVMFNEPCYKKEYFVTLTIPFSC